MAFWNSLMPMDAVHAWGWTLIHFAWQGCFIALAAAVGLQILKRASSAVKYAFLLAAFALMAMSPGVTFFWMESPQPGDLAIAAEELPDEIVAAPVSPGGVVELPFIDDTMGDDVTVALTPMMDQDRAGIAVSPLPFDTPSRSAEEGVEERLMEWMPLLVLFWALGVVVLSLRLLWSWYRLRQLLQRQLNRLSAEWNSRLDDIQNRLRLRRKVDTFSSGLAAVPMVIGWVRPAILIPASLLTSLSPRELEALLAHELAHLRRWDDVVNLLQSLVETVLFYHPAVWWLSRKLREERENCCDDIAADVIGDRVAYSRALLAAAEHATGSSNSLALAATGSDLTQRIRRLLNAESLGQPRSFWPLIAILLLSVGVGGAMALAQGLSEGEETTEQTVAKDENNEPEQREPVKTDWTVAEILEGINQTRERYRHAEYRSVSTQLRDANSFRPDAEEKWQQWIIDVDFRSDGERWDIARKAVHWNLEDGDNADRITENHRSVFDGKQHLTRERDVLTIGQEDSALKLNSPAEEFWRVGKNFSWLSGPLKADTAKVVGVDTSGPFPLVKILSRKESYGENEAPFDYDITISPQQSFLPVDVQITRDGKLDVSWTMFDLQKTQIGDWYPAKMEIEQGLVFPIKKETVKIFDFEIGKEYVASDFDASIPLGVDVVDHTSGTVYFNDPWWPEIGEWMENRFGWPPRRLSSLRELGSFTDGTIDGQPVPETAVSEWINGDPGPFHDPENVTLLFCFGGRLIDPTPRWWAGLKKLHDRYRDHPIRIVGLATDDAPEATRQLVEELRLPYSVGIDQASEDGGQGYGKTRDRFGMRTYTGIVAIDREGIVHTLDNPPNAGGGEPPLESLVRTLLGIEKPY
ncbi:MAG: M48 family metalloprotease, partial [Planctomycetaceae bacterium]|nr:M48 family metalloprotease [Planctomycetaceae bacterium]